MELLLFLISIVILIIAVWNIMKPTNRARVLIDALAQSYNFNPKVVYNISSAIDIFLCLLFVILSGILLFLSSASADDNEHKGILLIVAAVLFILSLLVLITQRIVFHYAYKAKKAFDTATTDACEVNTSGDE